MRFLQCTTFLMYVIVLVLGILVFGFKGIPNLFMVVVRFVKAKGSKKYLTLIFPSNKKYLPY